MNNSMKIQMDVKNNAQDLQNYMLDLKNWEEEMKKKETALNNEKPPATSNICPPRNKIKRKTQESEKNNSNKPKKISGYDYSAWDKFDVEKACAEIDEKNSEEKVSDSEQQSQEESEEEKDDSKKNEKDLSLADEAFYEKELGNQYVKKEQWKEAIKCYTNAINIDPKNPVYYSNRSLCFLKLKNFKAVEVDATVAVQLDKSYVKAYQRRAFARLALGQLVEAKSDYEQVLKIEPKNTLAKLEIDKINEKLKKDSKNVKVEPKRATFDPTCLFKSQEKKPEVNKSKNSSTSKPSSSQQLPEKKQEKEIKVTSNVPKVISKKKLYSETLNKNTKVDDDDDDDDNDDDKDKKTSVLPCIEKSNLFGPLPENCTIVHPIHLPPHKRSKKPLRRIPIVKMNSNKKVEVEPPEINETVKVKEVKIIEEEDDELLLEKIKKTLDVPKTAIQFQNSWKSIKKFPEEAYSYLKKIPGNKLPDIFQHSLESDFFSELITFLANDNVKKEPDFLYQFLLGLTNVKRFTSLIIFMSKEDKACVKKCITELENTKSKEEISELNRLYEL